MFAQYLLFDWPLDPADLARSPQEDGRRCRAYMRERCYPHAIGQDRRRCARH